MDLGGVLLNIDYNRTSAAFKALSGGAFDQMYSQAKQESLFDQLETGRIRPKEFREKLRELEFQGSDVELDTAWNAMLLDFPEHRLNFLEQLSKENTLYLFSNTNYIHIQSFEARMESEGQLERFRNCFQNIYYSSVVGRRKPEVSTFQWVLRAEGLEASKVLFIDDSEQHVVGAREAGVDAYHLKAGEEVSSLFI